MVGRTSNALMLCIVAIWLSSATRETRASIHAHACAHTHARTHAQMYVHTSKPYII